jgi:hypothetical protein
MKEFPKIASHRMNGFPKAAEVDNFSHSLHKLSSGFWKPINMGTSTFQNCIMTEIEVLGKSAEIRKCFHRKNLKNRFEFSATTK